MIPKKNIKSNLENKRGIFFEYGIIIALSISLVAFEIGKENINADEQYTSKTGEIIEEEMIQVTRPEPPKLPPPPAAPSIISIIEDPDINIDETFNWNIETSTTENLNYKVFEKPTEDPVEPPVFVIVKNMPTYEGGNTKKFQEHLQSLLVYPPLAVDMGIQGRVYVQFIVNEKGYIENAEVVRSPDKLLSDAVLAAMKKTKRWKAGEQRGMKVKVSFTVPVSFKLE